MAGLCADAAKMLHRVSVDWGGVGNGTAEFGLDVVNGGPNVEGVAELHLLCIYVLEKVEPANTIEHESLGDDVVEDVGHQRAEPRLGSDGFESGGQLLHLLVFGVEARGCGGLSIRVRRHTPSMRGACAVSSETRIRTQIARTRTWSAASCTISDSDASQRRRPMTSAGYCISG